MKFTLSSNHIPDNGLAGTISYALNNRMEVIFEDPDDNYYRVWEIFFPDSAKLQYNDPKIIQYYRNVEYWNGENWVLDPTINQRYLDSLNKSFLQ